MALTEDLTAHVHAIDEDHRELVRIITDLETAVETGSAALVLGSILGRLAEYAGDHFKREEFVMYSFGYPGFDRHKRQHDELLDRLGHVIFEFEAGTSLVTKSTIDLLSYWFDHHLAQDDSAFGAYLHRKFNGVPSVRLVTAGHGRVPASFVL